MVEYRTNQAGQPPSGPLLIKEGNCKERFHASWRAEGSWASVRKDFAFPRASALTNSLGAEREGSSATLAVYCHLLSARHLAAQKNRRSRGQDLRWLA